MSNPSMALPAPVGGGGSSSVASGLREAFSTLLPSVFGRLAVADSLAGLSDWQLKDLGLDPTVVRKPRRAIDLQTLNWN